MDIKTLLRDFNGNPPVADGEIQRFEDQTTIRLPSEYLQFLRDQNGGIGLIGSNSHAILWPLEELLRLNRQYEIDQRAPGMFIFGSDGGGDAFAFDLRSAGLPIVAIPFIGMSRDEAILLANTFQGFLEALAERES